MDLSKIQWIPVVCGAIAWAFAVAMVWLRYREPNAAQREYDFAHWKTMQDRPLATFDEFLASEQTPRIYLGRVSLCVVISAMALLLLIDALRRWAVFA